MWVLPLDLWLNRMLMMKKFHDLKKHFSHPRNELTTTSFQYRHRREGDRYASFPIYILAKLYIHANTNQIKAIPSPPIHKVDLEIPSVHVRSLTTNFEIFCAHRLLFKIQPRKKEKEPLCHYS